MGVFYIRGILILLGGILAASSLILSKSPNAKDMIAKIVPYQGLIGVGLLGYGVYDLITSLSVLSNFFKFKPPMFCLMMLGWYFGSIILGLILGTPLIAKYAGGGNEEKLVNLQKKLTAFQVIFGVVGIAVGVMFLLFALGVTSWGFGAVAAAAAAG
jgi:hypothetical protein